MKMGLMLIIRILRLQKVGWFPKNGTGLISNIKLVQHPQQLLKSEATQQWPSDLKIMIT